MKVWILQKSNAHRKTNAGGSFETQNFFFLPYHWATDTNYNHLRYKICIYIQYGVSVHTTFDLCNPIIPILIKKTLTNA